MDNQVKNGVRVKRIHTYKTGAIFEGEWNGHNREGYGMQLWSDETKYEG